MLVLIHQAAEFVHSHEIANNSNTTKSISYIHSRYIVVVCKSWIVL